MPGKEKQLRVEVDKLLARAAQADAEEDAKYGQGKQADELLPMLRLTAREGFLWATDAVRRPGPLDASRCREQRVVGVM